MLAALFEDTDGKMALDFFGPFMRQFFAESALASECAAKVWSFAQQALSRADDPYIKEKYVRLIEYLRPRLELWGAKP